MTAEVQYVVKVNSMDYWQCFRQNWARTGYGGFLTKTPILSNAPYTQPRCPPNKNKVFRRLISEEVKIRDVRKMKALQNLVHDVYRARKDDFCWGFMKCFEKSRINSGKVGGLSGPDRRLIYHSGSRTTHLKYRPN